MNYEWLGTSAVEGSKEQTGLFDCLKYSIDIDETYALENASSNYDVLVGHFEDEDGHRGYMITNPTNPYDDLTAEVSLTFSSKYQGALVVQNGEEKVVTLQNGKLTLDVTSAGAAFVIPLKAK
jgi:hypothetical protein